MILTCHQIQEAEAAAFARGVQASDLMDEAGLGIAEVILQFHPNGGTAMLFLGKGNNAGDALVTAKHLLQAGWQVMAWCAYPVEDFKPLPAQHWADLEEVVPVCQSVAEIARRQGRIVLVDGLVGIGAAHGPLREPLAGAVRAMNELRQRRHAFTVALDLPSGLNPETGVPEEPTVQADLTVTIAYVKAPLLADAAVGHVGRLAVVPLRELEDAKGDASEEVLTASTLLPRLPRRSFDFHKGQAGRVGLIAGSRGYLGAAILAAKGVLRGGAGLVTLYVKEDVYPLIAVKAPVEVMVKCVADYHEVLEQKHDCLGIGPGLGHANEVEVLEVICRAPCPVVLDADALNMLARTGLAALNERREPSLLTPHPGEMARLVEAMPGWSPQGRVQTAREFVEKFPATTLLLKGSRTVIAAQDHPTAYNTTGTPGMASGGMGDVLTGLSAALIGQGTGVYDAACLGAWLSGRAAEVAIASGAASEETLVASDVLLHLAAAFGEVRVNPC
ncbi:bifunctional ADP-dependent NAD(P)H-hydrate dehydratase/NAD(P)H-hydrate epimerase [Verrucomicrobium sp. BvORR034]|uniref:bifunctional ADP-dependent NAD(P)H-hydrate dehydratase/NAD(P)H-hydrate epimerase n=1 Tax=Verrucomicrobium sp. BvORR034 TaxID=1396418 RepID=UPI0006788576|nr:bifunctional ADP-dependent NAD(P)H-hydrate dehydratase/NAD(P)H-hydrate epimerase [Verrucomicrobium sp. BvORR034]